MNVDLIEKKPSNKNRALRNFSLYITEDPTNEGNVILRKILIKKYRTTQTSYLTNY